MLRRLVPLGLLGDHAPLRVGGPLTGHPEHALLEVEVGPAEPGELAAAQPAQQCQQPGHLQAIRARDLEEGGDLAAVPDLQLGLDLPRQGDVYRWVAGQHAVTDGVVKGLGQDPVRRPHGGG